jgi:hypothetical protein
MMTIAKHIAIHYGLLILAVFGVVETLRLLSTAWQDMKALSSAGVNGPRREVVLMRIYQSAFLLAVFGLFLSGGARAVHDAPVTAAAGRLSRRDVPVEAGTVRAST